ncbi:sporulation protein [Alkalihalobacillus sp. BA299]|uniref:sporulation protein n=1 Tax=Alkalihalobacillus sp. BA299 TaxID=2815938 RepID=UPI001ADB5810|nr:sporulation protein [Alkalihalobacillus sp. BA299]
MFEKFFSSIGIGSAKVETFLYDNKIERGKEVNGEVHIYGGKAEQHISEINIQIDLEFNKYYDEMTDFREFKEDILQIKIDAPFVIPPHELKVIPFSFTLPYYTPITFNEQKIYMQTELEINFFNCPISKNKLTIIDPFIDDILRLLTLHGFTHEWTSGFCRQKPPTAKNPSHYKQTFQLINKYGDKIHFIGNEENIEIYINENDQVHCFPIKREEEVSKQLQNILVISKKGTSH